jgi:hypothetical protein
MCEFVGGGLTLRLCNLCLILKTLSSKSCHKYNCNITLFATAFHTDEDNNTVYSMTHSTQMASCFSSPPENSQVRFTFTNFSRFRKTMINHVYKNLFFLTFLFGEAAAQHPLLGARLVRQLKPTTEHCKLESLHLCAGVPETGLPSLYTFLSSGTTHKAMTQ